MVVVGVKIGIFKCIRKFSTHPSGHVNRPLILVQIANTSLCRNTVKNIVLHLYIELMIILLNAHCMPIIHLKAPLKPRSVSAAAKQVKN